MKPILGFPGYYVNSRGEIYSDKKARKTKLGEVVPYKLKPYIDRNGYELYSLYNQAGKHLVPAHELVLEHFVGKRHKNKFPHHKDGDPRNNNKGNLEWVTEQELAQKLQGKPMLAPKGLRKRIKSIQKGL